MVSRPEMVAARPEAAEAWAAADALFPVRVTRSFWRRIDPHNPADPLALQVLPDRRELEAAPGDLTDPVGDQLKSPVPWVVHKHPDRVLLLLTKRCHLYCRYCFRRTLAPGENDDPTPAEWSAALEYARNSGAQEAILSGGDPLTLKDSRIFEAIDALRGAIPVIRIHTRAPITQPSRITPALVAGLRERNPVWVLVHCNHPNELSPEVDAALAMLVDAGIPVLNQAVLLRGVNDNPEVLVELCQAMVRRRVFPYYLHHTDAVAGNAHLRVSEPEGRALYRILKTRVSGLALPDYVIDPPDGSGKRSVETR